MTGELDMPKRVGWRQACRIMAALLALVVAYPASSGPAHYADRMDRLPRGTFAAAYRPLIAASLRARAVGRPYLAYLVWWDRLAARHGARHRGRRGGAAAPVGRSPSRSVP